MAIVNEEKHYSDFKEFLTEMDVPFKDVKNGYVNAIGGASLFLEPIPSWKRFFYRKKIFYRKISYISFSFTAGGIEYRCMLIDKTPTLGITYSDDRYRCNMVFPEKWGHDVVYNGDIQNYQFIIKLLITSMAGWEEIRYIYDILSSTRSIVSKVEEINGMKKEFKSQERDDDFWRLKCSRKDAVENDIWRLKYLEEVNIDNLIEIGKNKNNLSGSLVLISEMEKIMKEFDAWLGQQRKRGLDI